MSQTIAEFESSLQRKIGGTSISKVSGFYDLLREAASNVVAKIDPAETRRIVETLNVYDGVYDLAAPADMKSNAIIDFRPQIKRGVGDKVHQLLAVAFDTQKEYEDGNLQVRDNNAVKTIRLSKSVSPASILLHAMDSLTSNGTWVASGDASGLAVDTQYKVQGGASLKATLAANGSSGVFTVTDFTDVDLSDYDQFADFFKYVYLSAPTAFTSFTLRIGNDSSNYFEMSVTAPFDTTAFKTGWNLLKWDWSGATETGTVDTTAMDYAVLTVAYTSTTAITDFRMDELRAAPGVAHEIEYYSKYLFRDSSGTYKEVPTDDSDLINLDSDSLNILLYETAYLLAQEIQEEDAGFDESFFRRKLEGTPQEPGLYKVYAAQYPSERLKPRMVYYNMNRRSNRRYR